MAQYIQIIGSLGGIDVEKAEVGQIVRVKAVDENGNPTEWEAVDMPEGKVKTVNNIEADRDGNITIPSEIVASEVPPENTSALWVDLSDNEEDTPPSGTSIPPEQLEQIEKNKQDIEDLKNFKESDPTVPEWAKQPEKPTYTADEVGAQLKDFIVNITFNGEGYEADASFSEIGEKYASGVSVYALHNGRKYELLEFWEDEQASFFYRVTSSLDYRAFYMDYTGYIWYADGQLIDNYVMRVNGKTGWVNLTASDVGALPDTTKIPTVPTKVSAFTNDSGYQTAEQVTNAINTALGVIENGTY